jgi:thiol-disulfide isomerase/thioredoxin
MEMSQATPTAMLVFQPSCSEESVGIRDTAHGTIGPSRANTTPTTVTSDQGVPGNLRIFLPAQMRQAEEAENSVVSAFRTPRGLQLRSGDLLDATIESIDESGIRFHSTTTSCTFLPHEAIRSAEIKIPLRGLPIDAKKMERLLTVPRMKRDNPPTHLAVMSNGDYLRGRLVRLNGEMAEFEEGNSPIKIPRAALAVIIWLHERLWEKDSQADEIEDEQDAFQVHVRLRSAGRFTFRPEQIDKEKIYGNSPFIGSVNCSLSNIESIEFGKDIVSHIAKREENAWRLQLAKSPTVFEESDPNGLPMVEQLGTSSGLVGKTAPNFELQSIAGQQWRLGNQLGKVIILDFWASWCGPCMHAMPQVERIVTDLDREDVMWVGINIQETAERAQSAIDRLRIQSLVLLDEDGGVGTEYDARAIPLTVIIDREGLVQHVFVGGGDETLAGIEKAVIALVNKNNSPPPAP